MYEMTETDLTPLPATDPRITAMPAYQHEAQAFTGWAVWRHLARADALRSPDQVGAIQTVAAPPLVTPASESDAAPSASSQRPH
jgi:hypothetical protein